MLMYKASKKKKNHAWKLTTLINVKYFLSIHSIDITQVQLICQIAELCIEILAKIFLASFNFNPPYLMPYQAMGIPPHLG